MTRPETQIYSTPRNSFITTFTNLHLSVVICFYVCIIGFTSAPLKFALAQDAVIENTPAQVPDLIIAEILPKPTTAQKEFIEIHNPTSEAVSLAGWTLADNTTNSYTFPPNTTIQPLAYSAFFKGSSFTFALNDSGDTVTLTKPRPDEDTPGEVSTVVVYQKANEGESYAYNPEDLEKQYVWSPTPTPGAPNVFSQEETDPTPLPDPDPVVDANVIFNEVLPDPYGEDSEGEFIELHNIGEQEVSVKGWVIEKVIGEKTTKATLPDIVIKSGKFKALFPQESDVTLNNSGEVKLTLKSPTGEISSAFSYTGSTKGMSYALVDQEWQKTVTITPSTENSLYDVDIEKCFESEPGKEDEKEDEEDKSYPKLLLNEILPNPEGSDADAEFIEIYNPSSEAVSLKGWKLSDSSAKGTYSYKDDDEVPPYGFFTVFSDAFTFALNNTGDTVTLLNPKGDINSQFKYETSKEAVSYIFIDEIWIQTDILTPNALNINSRSASDNSQLASSGAQTLRLNEILANPDSESAHAQEFIEIYNFGEETISLNNWSLQDASRSGKYTFTPDDDPNQMRVDPGEYLTITKDIYGFALNNSSHETLTLKNQNDEVVSELTYEKALKNTSYGWDGTQWRSSPIITPGSVNEFTDQAYIQKVDVSHAYKDVATEFDVKVYGLTSDIKYRWDFGDGKKSYKHEPTHVYQKKGDYNASVTLTTKTDILTKQFIVEVDSYPKRKIEIIEIAPNPDGKDTGKETNNEYVVLKNTDSKKVSLKQWSIATGKDKESLTNHPLEKDITLSPGEEFLVTKSHANISLGNTFAAIELRTPDGSPIDLVSYDYTQTTEDDKKSRSVPEGARYVKINGNWQWILLSDDKKSVKGSDDTSLSQEEIDAIIQRAKENSRILGYDQGVQASENSLMNDDESKSLWTRILSWISGIISRDDGDTTAQHTPSLKDHSNQWESDYIIQSGFNALVCSEALWMGYDNPPHKSLCEVTDESSL